MTRSGAARLDALPTDPDSTRSSYPAISAMRADNGSKMFAARVTLGLPSSARYISFFLDMSWPPFASSRTLAETCSPGQLVDLGQAQRQQAGREALHFGIARHQIRLAQPARAA